MPKPTYLPCLLFMKVKALLATQPYLGKVESLLEGLEFPFRSLVTKSGLYKIIYFIDGDTVYISRIWDCRQDPRNINKL